jgi:ribosomal protein S18 acetylase RimI-like enzyme
MMATGARRYTSFVAAGAHIVTIELLSAADVVAVAQCIALDADMFPYASATFGLRDAAARAWLARDARGDGRRDVRGFVAGHVRREVLHVEGLAVDRGSRRLGIGRALVREAVEWARSEGIRAVALHVSVANPGAIALYRAEGFDVRRRLRAFYSPETYDGEGDAYEMDLRTGTGRREDGKQ